MDNRAEISSLDSLAKSADLALKRAKLLLHGLELRCQIFLHDNVATAPQTAAGNMTASTIFQPLV